MQLPAMSGMQTLFPTLLAVLAGITLVWWLVRRWEARLAAQQSYNLRFPLSPMVFLSRRLVIEGLVQDADVQGAIAERMAKTGQSHAEIERAVRRQADEIVPAFKAVFYFSIGYFLARALLLTLYRVRLVRNASDEYAKIGRDATVVLFMNHRSNMDVLLVNFLLAKHSAVAHAAGEWARLWPLHHLVRFAGNYVVDRDSNDPLYRLVLKRYVQMAVSHGIHLAIFPEGSLTRDGNLRPMSFGLLNYAATAAWPGFDRDVVFIPVSFSYDRIPEQERLVFGDRRDFKERGRLYVLASSLRFAFGFLRLPFTARDKRYGWACASFGTPVSLKHWRRARGIDFDSLSAGERHRHIAALGNQLMASVSGMVPVLPTQLVATALLEAPVGTASISVVTSRAAELARAAQAAGAPLFNYDTSEEQAQSEALRMLERLGCLELSGDDTVSVIASRKPLLQYYANSIAHHFKPLDIDERSADSTLAADPLASESRGRYLAIVSESYERVQRQSGKASGFFERFYRRFLESSPDVAAKFSGVDMVQQQAHLRRSLRHMVDFAISGKPDMRMRQIARMHSKAGKDIESGLYDLWLDSLMTTLAEYDPEFDTSVDLSWRSLMAPGVAYMRGQYDLGTDAESQSNLDEPVSKEGIARWLDHWAARAPARTALSSPERSLTYGELADEAGRLAAGLHSRLGVGAGDRVAYLGCNSVEFIALVFACARIGGVVVPLNFRLSQAELERLVERTEAKALLVDGQFRHKLQELPDRCRRVAIRHDRRAGDDLSYADVVNVPGPMTMNNGTMDAPLLIVFTSGSTGDPKGAVLSQGAVHWNALNSRVMHDMTRADHIATTLPFFHVGGINIQTLPALQVGATVTVFPAFDPAEFLQFVATARPTLTVLVPAQMQQLMKLANWISADLTSLRAVTTGSTIVSKDLITHWADKGIPVIQVYGCTESGPIAAHQTVEGIRSGWGTVGHPALYTEVMVSDGDGRPLAMGTEGEILLRGPSISSHYWRDENATRAAFRNGWLLTGDLGYLDSNGRLCVVGRKKRLIISGGENIHPAEIEHVLEQHPDVGEAAVVGIADQQWGEVPVAVVVTERGSGASEPGLREYLNQNLGRYKHPRHIFLTDSLPRTGLDKLAYPEISAFVEAAIASADPVEG